MRHEKFVLLDGPSGGDRGREGKVYLQVDETMNSLLPFRNNIHFREGRRSHGQGSNVNGVKGEAKYNKVKAKLALLSSSASASKASTVKNKGLITEAYEWDEEEVSSDDNEMVEVKLLMALAEENDVVSKEGARSEQRNNPLSKHINIVHELNACKEQLLVLKQAKLDFLTMRHCISEQIPSQKKRILGVDQLTKDSSSSGQKDLVFRKSSADDTKVSIPGVERPWLSEAEGFILPNHDVGRKGLKRQKEAKTIKIRQGSKETRARVKKQPKIQAGSARHSKESSQRSKE
ncbi:retrovirus-related pol polyprotein from transposon TNT 1-94 [Tanacetum coccineum]